MSNLQKKQRSIDQISHQVGGQLKQEENSHQPGGQLEMPEIFGGVPWKHHIYIVSKSETLDEALS